MTLATKTLAKWPAVWAAVLLSVALLPPAAASAEPVLEQVSTTVKKSRKLELVVESRLDGPGTLTLTGSVNGHAVRARKRVRAGPRTTKVGIVPRRFGLRKLDGPMVFELVATLREKRSGTEAAQAVSVEVPLPVVFLPGYGNEEAPQASEAFLVAFEVAARAAGLRYTQGAGGTLRAHGYASRTGSLTSHAAGLDRAVRQQLKGTPFTRVDVVGYSMGGLVARRWMADGGSARVRRCVFLATPNKGAPLVYVAVGLFDQGLLDAVLQDSGVALGDVGDALFTPETRASLRVFYPTYPWALPDNAFTRLLVAGFLGDPSAPLSALNAVPPPPGVEFHAVYYSELPGDLVGTVDTVNASQFLSLQGGGQVDPGQFATGAGDGLVPAHSVYMQGVAGWEAAITRHGDVREGSHVTMLADPRVVVRVAQILRSAP
jgi:pimeloyl-ACP methyl ester carboxylesterase